MAMGMRSSTVGDWLPIVKFDARSGRLFRIDKNDGGQNIPTEIPYGQTFGVDFGTLEAGYVYFSLQSGPVRQMIPYYEGVTMPVQPTERDDQNKMLYRPGFYVKILGTVFQTSSSGDGTVREWVSNASSLLNAMDDLYQRYRATPEAARGEIPIVTIAGVNPIKTGSGQRASTNYAPIFEIRGWAPRPEPLLGPRTTPIPGQEPRGPAPVAAPTPPQPSPNGQGNLVPPPAYTPPPPAQAQPQAQPWGTQAPVQPPPATSTPVQQPAAKPPASMPF